MATKIQSESDKRLIVKGSINGKDAYVMIDTGAVAGVLDKSAEKKYGLAINKKKEFQMVGAGGKFKAYLVTDPFVIGDRKVYQFLLADMSGVVKSVQNETGITIAGVLSLGQCKSLNISIDTDDNYISIDK